MTRRFPLIFIMVCVLLGCASRRAVQSVSSPSSSTNCVSVPERHYSPRYRWLYAEAVRQKVLENHVAAFDLLQHCLEIEPDSPEALFDMALYQRLLGQDSAALVGFERAATLSPTNVHYVEALAGLYLGQNKTDKALPVLEQLSALCPKRTDVLSRLVDIYGSVSRYSDALCALNRIEVLEGIMPAVSFRKAAIYKAMNDPDSAYHCLEALCDEYPHEQSYRLAIALELISDERLDDALSVIEEVRRRYGPSTSLSLAMMQYYRQSNADSAFAALRDSILLDASTASDIRTGLMNEIISENMLSDSIGLIRVDSVFGRMGIDSTTDLSLLKLRAAFLMRYAPTADSAVAAVMSRIVAIDPDVTEPLFYLIQYYGQRQDFVRLEDVCRRGVLSHPDQLLCHYYLGIALYQQDKKAEALEAFRGGIAQQTEQSRPAMVADLYSLMGDVLHEMGRRREAYAAYDSCLVYQDDNASCLNNYAYFLSIEDGDLDRAEEMSYRTVRLQPDNKTFLDTYAWILFQKERYAEARSYMDRVCPPDSTDSVLLVMENVGGVVLEHAGDIAAATGDMDLALRFWRLAQQAGGEGLSATLPRKIREKRLKFKKK